MIRETAESYNRIANQWDAARSGRIVDSCVAEFCEILPRRARILDAGCGTGKPIAKYCHDLGFDVTGIDVSEAMIRKAAAYVPDARFECADFLSYQAPTPFDGIIAFDSLWHIERAKQPLIYPKASALLKPGGYFLFTAGLTDGEVHGEMFGQPFAYAALDQDEIRALLTCSGFAIARFEPHYRHPTSGDRDLLAVAQKQTR